MRCESCSGDLRHGETNGWENDFSAIYMELYCVDCGKMHIVEYKNPEVVGSSY